MVLTPCFDCNRNVSPTARSCPNCGALQLPTCPRCGARCVQHVEGLRGAREILTGIVLLALLLLPGLAYYFDRQRLPYCTNCKHRVRHLQAA